MTADFAATQPGVMEADVFLDPVFIGFAGTLGVMFQADGVPHLVEEFPSPLGRRRNGIRR